MKIAILGAAGHAGRRIVAEALTRGHQVLALGPTRETLESLGDVQVATADITEPVTLAPILAGVDVMVSAVRFVRYDPDALVSVAVQSGVPRLLVVGGAGSLLGPTGALVADGPTFPEDAKPEAAAGQNVLNRLKAEPALNWTFLSPSAVFTAGERTGRFRLGKDHLLIGADGKSHISFEDYAVAMLDEIETPAHPRQRFTVGY